MDRASGTACFPKSARLLKTRDFHFRPFRKFEGDRFRMLYSLNGSGRLGISVSRKVSKRAVVRNRIRRLLKEAFRLKRDEFLGIDVHVIALSNSVSGAWKQISFEDVQETLAHFTQSLSERALRTRNGC